MFVIYFLRKSITGGQNERVKKDDDIFVEPEKNIGRVTICLAVTHWEYTFHIRLIVGRPALPTHLSYYLCGLGKSFFDAACAETNRLVSALPEFSIRHLRVLWSPSFSLHFFTRAESTNPFPFSCQWEDGDDDDDGGWGGRGKKKMFFNRLCACTTSKRGTFHPHHFLSCAGIKCSCFFFPPSFFRDYLFSFFIGFFCM